jgi:hypothetical protein
MQVLEAAINEALGRFLEEEGRSHKRIQARPGIVGPGSGKKLTDFA